MSGHDDCRYRGRAGVAGRQGCEGVGNKPERGAVLREALTVINGERQDSYGNPEDSHSLIAALWGAYLGVTITAREAAEMMVLFKVARMRGQKPHMDNYRDAAGYLGIAADMVEAQSHSADPVSDVFCREQAQ